MSPKNFDAIITSIVKPCGWWQFLNFLFCIFPVFLPYDLLLVYITNTPNFRFNSDCIAVNNAAKTTNDTFTIWTKNHTKQCPSEELSRNRFCNDTTFLFDHSRPEWRGTLIEEFQLVCDRAYIKPMVISMFNLGQLLSCFVSSIMADKFGRKPIIIVSAFTVLMLSMVVIFTPSVIIFLVCQVFLGIGHLTMWNVLFVHLLEITNSEFRITVTTTMQVFYGLGLSVFIPSLAYLTQNWRTMYIVMTVLSSCCLLLPCTLSESPRWLMSRNNRGNVLKTMKRAYRLNNRSSTTEKIERDSETVKSFVDNFSLTNSSRQGDSIWKKIVNAINETLLIVKVPILRTKFIQFVTLWFTVSVAYFLAIFNTSSINLNYYLSTSIICGSLVPSQFIRQFLLSDISLKTSTIATSVAEIAILVTLVCLQVFAADNMITSIVMFLLALLGKILCDIMFSVLYNHTAECFPTEVRVYTLGICSGVARVGSIAAIFLLNFSVDSWRPLPMVIVVFLFCICICIGVGFSGHVSSMPDTILDVKQKQKNAELYGNEEQRASKMELEIINLPEETI